MAEGRTVEIVGAGIAGLTAATLLSRAGWKTRVHERNADVREIGAGIFIKNNAVSILEEMGLFESLRPKGEQLGWAEIWDHRGRQLQRRTLAGDARVYNFPRQELLTVLRAAALEAGAVIATSSRAVSASADGKLLLEDGTVLTASLIVGADGHRSSIRGSLGLTKRFGELSTGAIRMLVPRTPDDGDSHTSEYWSGARRIGIAACSKDATYLYMSARSDDEAGTAIPVRTEEWAKAFPRVRDSLWPRLSEGLAVHHPYTYAKASSWSSGRVAIVGDAAHALPPTLGQGAGLTIMNVRALVKALAAQDVVAEALRAWEARCRGVTDATQRWSLRYDRMMTIWPVPLSDVRSGIIWAVGRSRTLNGRMRVADRARL